MTTRTATQRFPAATTMLFVSRSIARVNQLVAS
jgi:hypothetical protein